ncbi:MAG: DNA polymerase [Gammaproteobacteria bacterium]|nr:DNA polymerase [Gammaproteobacteria bacterium]|tara:strand:+ start:23137 stop:23505 length:369 start_codon:yes stop_codon:yes gene_type:complete
MSPFDYLKAINSTKKDIFESEKDYSPFMINRGLSYFPDTVLFANEMNKYHHIDHRLQFDFLINIIRKRNRFSKWNKKIKLSDLDAVKSYYGYSSEKARDVLPLLSKEQLKIIKESINYGGVQ